MKKGFSLLVFALFFALLCGCEVKGPQETPVSPSPSETTYPSEAVAPTQLLPTAAASPSETPPLTEAMELDGEAICERYHFKIRHPKSWEVVIQGYTIDAPDQGIKIFVDNNEDALVHPYGDARGFIPPGNAGVPGCTVADYETSFGMTGKLYTYIDKNNVRWEIAIFGEYEKYAIFVNMDNDIYQEYEATILAIMDSFEFYDGTVT